MTMRLPAFVSRLSPRERFLAGVTLAVVLGYGGYVLAYQPLWKRVQSVKAQLETLRGEVAGLQAQVADSKARLRALETGERPRVSVSLLPAYVPVSRVLEDFSLAARAERIQLLELTPGAVEDRGEYRERRVRVAFRGRFAALTGYLERLERLEHPLAIQQVRIEAPPDTAPMLQVVLDAAVYMAKGGDAR